MDCTCFSWSAYERVGPLNLIQVHIVYLDDFGADAEESFAQTICFLEDDHVFWQQKTIYCIQLNWYREYIHHHYDFNDAAECIQINWQNLLKNMSFLFKNLVQLMQMDLKLLSLQNIVLGALLV